MSLTISTKSYTLDRVDPDSVRYAGPANTLSSKDTLELKRVYPKPTAVFAGVARPTIKFVRTVEVDAVSGAVADAILQISGSLPVGITEADIDSLVADMVSMLGLETAETTHVCDSLDINY